MFEDSNSWLGRVNGSMLVRSKSVVVVGVVFVVLADLLFAMLPSKGAIIATIVLFVVGVPLLTWRVRKSFPAGGIGQTAEKIIAVPYPFERVSQAVIATVADCGWKLTQANSEVGHFKAKIGRSFMTAYGQVVTIDVMRVNESSSNIDITCSALYQLMGANGQNNEMIDTFKNWLINRLTGKLASIPR